MTTNPPRPEVDDPRVLALAKARQHIAHSNPFNVVCPPWDGLSSDEQHLSLLDARNYLRAAIDAGLVPAVVSPPPATNQTLRDQVADVIRGFPFDDFGLDDVSYLIESEPDTQEWVPKLADAVLAVLPGDNRGVVLALVDKLIEHCPDHGCVEPEWENGCHCEIVPLLRDLADEAQQRCPGVETVPNRCTCDCEGCAHHCGAHNPAVEAQPQECSASISGRCLRETESETACDTGDGECVHGGRPGVEAQQQPDTETEPSTPGPWIVQKICCGHDDGTVEFPTWVAADSFREVYVDSAGIAGHERSAIVRGGHASASGPGGMADEEPAKTAEVDRVVAYRTPGTRKLHCVICARQETGAEPVTHADEQAVCDFCGGRVHAVAGQTLAATVARYLPDATPVAAPFTPPVHYRRDDGVNCCVHTIPVGPDSCRECRELADDEETHRG